MKTDASNAALDRETAAKDALAEQAESDEQAIARLAKMGPLDYDRCRKTEAERLGVSVGALDKAVGLERGEDNPSDGAGRAFTLDDPEPWPEPVDGAHLLDEMSAGIARHMVLTPTSADAVALWCVFTWTIDVARIATRLAVLSPVKRCGKTRLCELVGLLVRRLLPTVDITPATFFRVVEKWGPTVIIDEAHVALEKSEALQPLLNAGHSRAQARAVRLVGDDHKICSFNIFTPVMLAAAGKSPLPDMVLDRCVVIQLRRRMRTEPCARLHRRAATECLQELARKAARWTQDNLHRLQDAEPVPVESLNDRAQDNWEPLLAIADAAGGAWPERARKAALILSGADDLEDETPAIQLLGDVREAFKERGVDRLPSKELCEALAGMDGRPWADWARGKPITTNQLGRMLKPFGVRPSTIRLGATTAKGYLLDKLTDDFKRYLPQPPPFEPSQRHNPQKTAKNELFDPSQGRADVTDRNGQKPRNSAGCDGVTDENPPPSGEEGFEPGADIGAEDESEH